MNLKENLYFIALIPQREVREEITTFKNDFANRFKSKKALKVYPHITLKAPFKFPEDSHANVINWFDNLKISHRPFNVNLKNFDAFHNKHNPVVFINPVITEELIKIQREILVDFKKLFPGNVHPVDLNFKPHVTIAYRDLEPEQFSKAWSEYKDKKYSAVFKVNGFYLLQHDKKKWNLISTYSLS